jgi:DNA-binding beta-propeller fold protein YncE
MTLVIVAAACGPEPPDRWFQPLDFRGLDVGDRQVYVSNTAQRAVALDPVRDGDEIRLDISVQPVGTEPGASAVATDGETYYVVDEENEVLGIVDSASGDRTEVELDSAFDRIAVDPHGDFLVLYFSGDSDGTIVARNLNEIGVVDLRSNTPSAEFLTLASRPRAIEFAPPFTLEGNDQRMAAVLSANEVTILDLEELAEPEDALREVPLTISEADQVKTPRSIAFDVTPADGEEDVVRVYVLADNSSDITEITVQPAVLEDSPRKLDLAVNQLAAGQNPVAMELLELPAGSRLLAIDGNQPRFTIVDVASGEGATFDLPMTQAARSMKVYTTTIQEDGEEVPETRVLAYSPGSALVSVIRPETIAVAGDEPTLGRSVEAVRLERRPQRIEFADEASDRALVFHDGAQAGFTILDLRKNVDIPIQGGTLRDVHFDGTFAYATFQTLNNFTVFGLDGHPTNFDLPRSGQDIFLDVEDELLLVRHNDPLGMFTVLDANEPTPENARVYEGVFTHELLDQELR